MLHTQQYNHWFSWKKTFYYCILVWVASLVITIPTHFGWGGNKFDTKSMACLYDRTKDASYTAFFAVMGIVIPLITVIVCYTKIFLFVRVNRRRVANFITADTSAAQRSRDEIKLAKTLFIICLVFFIFWGTYGVTVVFDFYDTWPKAWHAFSLQMAHSTSSGVNFILYGITNERFRNAYRRILGCAAIKSEGQTTYTASTRPEQMTRTNDTTLKEIQTVS